MLRGSFRRGFALFASAVLLFQSAAVTFAAEGGYLSGYAEPDPRPTAVSWWSTLAYLLSLLAVFAVVLLMAYWASRFLGGRFARLSGNADGQILMHLPLGPNRSVCVVELAQRVFMLGVTEHSITLLRELTDSEEIERLRQRASHPPSGMDMFSSQIGSLERLAKRIPSLFGDGGYRR